MRIKTKTKDGQKQTGNSIESVSSAAFTNVYAGQKHISILIGGSMRENVVATRLDSDSNEQFTALARSKGMTKSALAHMFILDGIAQFDRRNDALLDRVDALIDLVAKSNVLAASAVASAALPPGVGGTEDEAIKAQMRNHISEAVKLGRNISSTYDKGTFGHGGDNVPSN